MKNLLIFAIAVVTLASCASTKSSNKVTPVGDWNYAITGTPEGDFSGIMKITSIDKGYKSVMNARGNNIELEKFSYDAVSKKMKGEFYYSGSLVIFDGTFDADAINGSMSAGGMDFPFKATRVKK